MSVVHIIDTVTEWVRENVCSEIQLKVPPADERAPTDAGYSYELATPAAFSMFVPAKDKLPPSILSPVPSVCVRFMEGAENLAGSSGSIGIQLCFSTWDPGIHGKDVFIPTDGKPGAFQRMSNEEAAEYFQRNGDGWRDAWNFVDIALRKLGNTLALNGIVIDRTTPIKFGPLTEQEAIIDYYPMWFAWVSFSVEYPLRRHVAELDKFL